MSKLTLYYWPLLGRANAAVRMLEEAGIEYEHVSDMKQLAGKASAFGAQGTTFAPPIVQDGDKIISQTIAVNQYIGEKCGFDKGVDRALALQYMLDAGDLQSELGRKNENPDTFCDFMKGKDGKPSRFSLWLNNIERSIKGPFYFGDTATYVDYHLTATMDWLEGMTFNAVKEETGTDYLEDATKVRELVGRIRALESYKKFDRLPLKTPTMGIKKDVIEGLSATQKVTA